MLSILLAACGVSAPPVTGEQDQFTVSSEIVGDTYLILTRTPPSYDPTRKYPVVYQLDATNFGNEFNLTAGAASELEADGRLQPTIVVGIGYPYDNSTPDGRGRWRDYVNDSLNDGPTMGATNFLRFIREELIPVVDEKFATSSRTLAGHSLGGVFSLYTLFVTGQDIDPPFQNFIVNDAGLGDLGVIDAEAALAQKTSSLPRTVWIDIARYDGASQSLWLDVLSARMERYGDLDLRTHVYDTDHAGVMFPGFRDGLLHAVGGAQ